MTCDFLSRVLVFNTTCFNRLSFRHFEDGLLIKRQGINIKRAFYSVLVLLYFFIVFRLIFTSDILYENYYPLITLYILSASLFSYLLVNGWLNSTRIRLDHDSMKIGQWPVPFQGLKQIPSSEIAYLYIRNNFHPKSGKHHVDYGVHALTLGGRDLEIIDGLCSSNQAVQVKEDIASFLDLDEIPSCRHAMS